MLAQGLVGMVPRTSTLGTKERKRRRCRRLETTNVLLDSQLPGFDTKRTVARIYDDLVQLLLLLQSKCEQTFRNPFDSALNQ